MSKIDRLVEIKNNCLDSIEAIDPPGSYPKMSKLIDSFISAASHVGDMDHYKFFPEQSLDILGKIPGQFGESGVKVFLRLVLLRAIVLIIDSGRVEMLPPRVRKNQLAHFDRISIETGVVDHWLNIESDLFQKEFGLVSLRLFAAGAQLVDPRCGIPRSLVIKDGFWKAPSKSLTFLRFGGFKPYFQIHTHKFNLELFNEAGWVECYLCCAELYQIFPKHLGMFGSSWFYDPELDGISPRLAYLRSTPLGGGACLMYYSSGGDAIGNATATSEARRKLFESGKYLPKSYMLIWNRDAQCSWAMKNS